MDGLRLDASLHDGQTSGDTVGASGKRSPDSPATLKEHSKCTYIPVSARVQSSATPIRYALVAAQDPEAEEQLGRFSGYGVTPGTLELVELQRPELINKPSLPLANASSKPCPIIQEYSRPWRALRLGTQPGLEQGDGLPQDQCLLKNYEPQFVAGGPTFPSVVDIPPYLKPRIAVDEASAFVVLPHVRFGLGTVEPLFCHVMVYDISLCCRVTEEYHFTLPGPSLSTREPSGFSGSVDSVWTHASEGLRAALLYILPNHQPQHLYLVLKVAKILSGDGDTATSPYCNPEKMATLLEQQRLVNRAADCSQRLGRYRQPLAWGAISLMEGTNRPMTLYRQRTAINDELRIPMVADAVRGTLKEKIVPATCEFDIKRVHEDYLVKCKFQQRIPVKAHLSDIGDQHGENPPAFSVVDPFTAAVDSVSAPDPPRGASGSSRDTSVIHCREMQPFCHPSTISMFGLSGSGPVATSYVNVLYVYPVRLERFQHRNVAIQVQLLEREIDAIGSVKETELRQEVLPALYSSDSDGVVRSEYTFVSYHQKNPQFENEFKICLPGQLSRTHHMLFTFYHVHCKKLQPAQRQQELVGYAVLPLLGKDGTILNDASYSVSVFSAPAPGKQSKMSQGMALHPNYLDAARETSSETSKGTNFTCRTRVLSSVYSQDRSIAELLEPFHATDISSSRSHTATTSDVIVSTLLGLRQANAVHLRYFLLSVAHFVLGYLRTGPSVVRWAAFRAMLTIFEKVSWSSHRSLKPQLQEANQILYHYVQMIFDEGLTAALCPVTEKESRHQPLYRAIMKEWLHVLQDNGPIEENIEAKRVSITFSHVLLQLVLKSMAMNQLGTKRSELFTITAIAATRALPKRLVREDDLLVERLVGELILCAGNASMGLLLQKEANQSIAWFCRGLFLVVLNSVPGRVVCRYIESMERSNGDPNTLVHLLFPFLQILIDFEFFATVNGATVAQSRVKSISLVTLSSSSGSWTFQRAWLAQVIFRALLRVVDEQKELKISCGAARLLRHLFVVHVQNPRHQTREEQEAIALTYTPFLKVLAEFTADQKLFAGGGPTDGAESNTDSTSSSHFQLKKELLICVTHLLSVVSDQNLPRFFCDEPETVAALGAGEGALNEWRQTSALSPTSALMHYRKVVNERKMSAKSRTGQFLLPQIAESDGNATPGHLQANTRATFGDTATSPAFDEVRVHACFALIHHMIDVFLVDVSAAQPDPSQPSSMSLWKRFLSPSLSTSEALLSLQELEYQVRHRGSHHRISTALSSDEATVISRRVNTHASSSAQNLTAPARLSHSSSAPTVSGSSSGCRTPLQRSMPRAWGKNYASAQQKRSTSENPSFDAKAASNSSLVLRSGAESTRKLTVAPLEDHEEEHCVSNMRCIIATTALRALQTAVNQFEHVIRLIKIPLDHQRGRGTSYRKSSASIGQAYALLGSLTELLFFLLWRASKIDCLNGSDDGATAESSDSDHDAEHSRQTACVVIELLSYLIALLQRFQKSLFACRVPGLPLIHDEHRVGQLITIACTSRSASVRRHAAMLLSSLVAACYDQTGSFLLVKGPILKVLTSAFYPDGDQDARSPLAPPTLSTEALRDLIEEMRQCFQGSERESRSFQIQVVDLLNGLTTQIKVYEIWRGAVSDADAIHDFEEVEDGLFRVFQSLSALWLPSQKQQWLRALLRLHVMRGNFAEAVICKLRSIQVARDVADNSDSSDNCDEWIVRELLCARELAERAQWTQKEVEICEELLALFKQHRRYADYQSTLRHLDGVVSKLADSSIHFDDGSDSGADNVISGLAFYRVKFAGDSVAAHISRNEYIYKRSTFTSLGDFVGEMKAMLRAKYPMCERVDVVPESKPLPTSDDQPNVIFMRVSSLEQVQDVPLPGFSEDAAIRQATCAIFKLATPFTLSSSKSYGKTAEQLKRVTYMSVAHEFPCMLSRQVVQRRVEIMRCPIETAMDDIRKRCALLRAEIRKEMHGHTDLKTLTLVLKGSVDTHVHGGIPEVIESFLAAVPTSSGASDTATPGDGCSSANIGRGNDNDDHGALPTLLTATGAAMGAGDSLRRRHELANLLVEFAVLCCRCLLISRDAFRRCSTPTSSSAAATATASSSTTATTGAASLSASSQLPLPYSSLVTSTTMMPVSTLAILASEAKMADCVSSLASSTLTPSAATSATPVISTTRASNEVKSIDEWLALVLPDVINLQPGAGGGPPDAPMSSVSESPLQQELERSFAALVQLMHAQIRFPFASTTVLSSLLQRLERLRMRASSEPSAPPTEKPA